ncbi:MAG TPA: tetratricopeptide repeat protein [Acidobacteriaceae bacterium]|jgi:tetratricopeptide (TPR) repeat protein|nr:tetratricopeptide repeat protein [Acidobacteriaceae bacterium]
MNRIARFPVVAAATILLVASATGCKRLEARDQLNKGVQAYKQAKYEEAIDHFQRAVNLDPTYPMTRLYLATAYAQQVVPNLDTPENEKTAQMAINGFEEVLREHPDDVTSMKQIAALNFDLDKFDQAKEWQLKVFTANPKDAEAAYTIGVIDWTLAYKNAMHALQGAGMQDDGTGNQKMPKPVCKTLQDENASLVDDGLKYLQVAVDLRPNYDAAMQYLNLLYRRKADLDCGNDSARKADLAQAEDWVHKAMGARKVNEQKANEKATGGVVMQ